VEHGSRLFLFWLRVVKETPGGAGSSVPTPKDGNFSNLTYNDVTTAAAKSSKVHVQALLCFSERLNGKWQPTRTSDPDVPGDLLAEAQDPASFQRAALRLVTLATDPQGALVLLTPSNGKGFTLFNTHSLPVRNEDSMVASNAVTTANTAEQRY